MPTLTVLVPAALGWSLLLFWVAFAIGKRAGKKKGLNIEPGVEVIFHKWGYRIRAEKVWEHRYRAELCLGRALASNEVVHHINGKRWDNRLQNLCVLDRHKHEQFHAWLKWKRGKEKRYPSETDLRKILTREYGGIVLSDVPVKMSRTG